MAEPITGLEPAAASANERARTGFFGHPKGMFYIFSMEIWERFSFFGMKAILLFYLIDSVGMGDAEALKFYGSYTALLYCASVLGALYSDRWLGPRRALGAGGALMFAGLAIAASVPPDAGGMGPWLLLGFGLQIVGTGFIKPNTLALVGRLYQPGDPRLNGGYTLFNMAINIGAFAAPIACGYIGSRYGWQMGFALAAIGMLVGLCIFAAGQAALRATDLHDVGRQPHTKPARLVWITGIAAAAAAGTQLIAQPQLTQALLVMLCTTAIGAVLWRTWQLRGLQASRNLIVILVLYLFFIIYFCLSEQSGSTLNLMADRHMDLGIGSWQFTAAQTPALGPMFITLHSPLLAMLWTRSARRGNDSGAPTKFAIGLLWLAIAFFILAAGATLATDGQQLGLIWLVGFYATAMIGDVYIMPIGFAAVSRLSEPERTTFMMSFWLLGVALALLLSSQLAGRIVPDAAVAEQGRGGGLEIFAQWFWGIGFFVMAAAGVLALLRPALARLERQTTGKV
jgi:proton-dependent oligopeptide transporter, POT family